MLSFSSDAFSTDFMAVASFSVFSSSVAGRLHCDRGSSITPSSSAAWGTAPRDSGALLQELSGIDSNLVGEFRDSPARLDYSPHELSNLFGKLDCRTPLLDYSPNTKSC